MNVLGRLVSVILKTAPFYHNHIRYAKTMNVFFSYKIFRLAFVMPAISTACNAMATKIIIKYRNKQQPTYRTLFYFDLGSGKLLAVSNSEPSSYAGVGFHPLLYIYGWLPVPREPNRNKNNNNNQQMWAIPHLCIRTTFAVPLMKKLNE